MGRTSIVRNYELVRSKIHISKPTALFSRTKLDVNGYKARKRKEKKN